MAYIFEMDGVALPVAPSKMQMKIKNKNKRINLINDGEVNILKSAGLTDISFTVMIPHVEYPFGYYPDQFKPAYYYLSKFKELKKNKKPFRFNVYRNKIMGAKVFGTTMLVSIEDYAIEENAADGQSVNVSINLKEWKPYKTKVVAISKKNEENVATIQTTRETGSAPKPKTYTVKQGDTLWNISKKNLGQGAKYREIASLNNIANPNLIFPGQVLTMPIEEVSQ